MKGVPDPGSLLADSAWVRGLAQHLVRDEHTADDVVQDALLSAVRHRPRQVRAWLRTTVRNLAVTTRRRRERRRQREKVAARPESTASVADLAARAEAQRRVVAAVLALDDPYRTAVLLRYFDDLSPKEIARRTGEPAATVRSRLKRALDMLRGRLDAEYGGQPGAWCAAFLPLALAPRRALATGGVVAGVKSKAALFAALLILLVATVWITVDLRSGSTPPPRQGLATRADGGATEAVEESLEHAPADRVVRRVDVDGTVVDQEGAGVAGAWVAIVPGRERHGLGNWFRELEHLTDPPAPVAETRADENGRFRLDLPAGSLDVIVAIAPGYAVARLAKLDLAEGATNVVLRLKPDILLRGRVESLAGDPIEGATVRPWNAGVPLRHVTATTDASGRFEMVTSADPFLVAVHHPDYVGMVFKLDEERPNRVVFVLERGAALEGVVRHVDTREPLAGVEVAIFHGSTQDAGPLLQRVRTGSDGRFRFERAPTRGHLSVYVGDGRQGRIGTPPIPWSERWKLEEILLGQGKSVTGRVVRRNGDAVEGVAGVRVLVRDQIGFGGSPRGPQRAVSGPDGRFTVEGIRWGARAYLDPRELGFVRVYHSEDPMVIGVGTAVAVRGRVLDDAGAPVPAALVRTQSSISVGGGEVFSGAEGVFVLRGLAPNAPILARKDGYAEARGIAADGVELVLRRQPRPKPRGANSLWGTVVDIFGDPLLGVRVSVSGGHQAIARRGRYELTGVRDGELEIVASRPGFKEARLSGVRAGPGGVEVPPLVLEEAPQETASQPPAGSLSIEGVVLDEYGRPGPLAHVTCVPPAGEAITAFAGLNGRFRLIGLVPGSYRLEKPYSGPYVYDPLVVDAGTKDIVLRPRLGATIEGRVVGAEPGDGPFRAWAAGETSRGAQTDGEGRFVIQGLPEGRYTVSVTRHGWFLDPPLEGVAAGTKGLELRAVRAVSLRGRVVTSDASPLGNISVRIANRNA
ncbi:MAG: sigma-70 family RNA polymerase sigma factor, partial [Planctomycetota bacterium]